MTLQRLAQAAKPGGALCPFPGSCLTHAARILRSAIWGACLTTSSNAAASKEILVQWDRNPESDIAYYQVAYGATPGSRASTANSGQEVEKRFSGLEAGRIYYFAVAAVNTSGLMSDYSEEISVLAPAADSISAKSWITAAGNAADRNPATLWQAASGQRDLDIQLSEVQSVAGFRYLPRQDGSNVGNVAGYEIYLSTDGASWGQPVAKGTFPASAAIQDVRFAAAAAKYVRFRSLSDAAGSGAFVVSEVEILKGAAPAPANRAPVALAASHAGSEDTPLPITLRATDEDGDALTYTVTRSPLHGTLSGAPPSLTYHPAADFHGADSFAFRAGDGRLESAEAEISLQIAAVNDAPVAFAASATTTRNTPVAVKLAGADPEGDSLTFTVVSQPAKGTLSGTPPNLTYTPAKDYTGADSFTFRVSDGSADSAAATVSLVVNPANRTPIAPSLLVQSTEDTPVAITLVGVDPDGDPLTFTLLTPPANGTLTGIPPYLVYTPAKDYFGVDPFTYQVSDGQAVSAPGTMAVFSAPVNDLPVAVPAAHSTTKDTPVSFVLGGTDVEGDSLTFAIVSGPAHGSLSGTPPAVTYTPAAKYAGPDEFTFRVNDGKGDSPTARVTLQVQNTNAAPVALAKTVTTSKRIPVAITLGATDADGDPLTFATITPPAHGTLSGKAPNLTYTPTGNFHGTDSFTFRANDGLADSAPATVTVQVVNTNAAPVVAPLALSTAEDQPLPITLAGSDVDDDILTFAVVAGPKNGTLTGTAPNLTYTPAANFHGSDSFSFRASDGALNSETVVVSITVTPVNDAPIALSKSLGTPKRTPVEILLAATDIDGDPLTFAIVTPPAHGTLSGKAPNLTYTPTGNFTGLDGFSFRANDGTADSAVATVSIVVSPTNTAPSATPASVTTAEDKPLAITLAAADPDEDALTFSVVSGPKNGTLTGTAPNLTYTPAANFHGSDSFSFRASDGALNSETVVVSITVTPVNDLPLAAAGSAATTKRTPVAIELSGSDVDGDGLTFEVVSQPANGTLSGKAPNLTYAPTGNFHGSDQFTFRVHDGTGFSAPAVISIVVADTNTAPVAGSAALVTAEDAPLALVLGASDVDENPLTYEIVAAPGHGTLSGKAPNLTYTPAKDFHGQDSFTFRASDGQLASTVAVISIKVTPVNDAPLAVSQSLVTLKRIPLPVVLTGSDVDGDALSFILASPPSHGTLSGTPPALTYTPTENYTGADSFTFRTSDGTLQSAVATISLLVKNSNTAPQATGAALTTAEDQPLPLTLGASDPDDDVLTYVIVSAPQHGTLSGTAPQLTYTPAADFHGADSFSFRVSDGALVSEMATVSLVVRPVNDAPVALAKSVTTAKRTAVAITLAATDVDGDPLVLSIVTAPAHGTLSGKMPDLVYTPTGNFAGPDSFTFRANDGTVNSAPATVSILVQPSNTAPVATGAALTTAEDKALGLVLAASDIDADPLTYKILSQPARGTLTGTAPNLTYTPAADFHGSDSFIFSVSDGVLDSQPATIAITVTPVNDLPIALAKAVTTLKRTPVSIALSATDVDGDALTFAVATQPANGTLSGKAPALVYTPNGNFSGADSFTFRANDGTADSAVATVTITVKNTNEAPVATPLFLTTAEDKPLAITLTASDIDGDVLIFSAVSAPAHGTLGGTPPNLTYIPAADFHGSDSFTFRASDGALASQIAKVSIAVTPVNDLPVAVSQAVTVPRKKSVPVTLVATDVDGDALTYAILAAPAHGTLQGTPPNLTYMPAADYTGPDLFTFRGHDGTGSSAIAGISITVTADNILPVAQAQSITTRENVPVTVTLAATDADGDPLTYSVSRGPAHGALSGTAPRLTYQPSSGFSGADSFSFVAHDGFGNSQPATVSIEVTRPAPFDGGEVVRRAAWQLRFVGSEASPATAAAASFDGDPATVWQSTTSAGAPHEIQIDLGASTSVSGFQYLPCREAGNPGHIGAYEFYVSQDGVNWGAPVASGRFLASAAEKQVLITATRGRFVCLRALSATDGSGEIRVAEFNVISGAWVNSRPLAAAAAVATEARTPVAITLAGSDADGGALSYRIVRAPAHGTLSGTAPELTYTPAAGFDGADDFAFVTNDGAEDSLPAVVSLTVTAEVVEPSNTPPVFAGTVLTYPNGAELLAYQTPALTAVDPDAGDELTFGKISGPGWLLVGATGELSGTPDEGSAGMNTFQIQVADAAGATAVATLRIRVNPNRLPLPWTLHQFGGGQAGAAKTRNGVVRLQGSGSLGRSTADGSSFSWQRLTGNGEIVARVRMPRNADAAATAGLMIRQSLADDSRQVFLGLDGSGKLDWIRRTTAGRKSASSTRGTAPAPRVWLKLVRKGRIVTAFRSSDGSAWEKVARTKVKLAKSCYVGLAVSSGSPTQSVTAKFSNLQVTH